PILDPHFSIAGTRELIDIASPLLREVVNHATWAYARCQGEPSFEYIESECVASFMLYRHVIEFTDSIEVLVANGCSVPALTLLRSSFEACLGLEYIMESDFRNRSL